MNDRLKEQVDKLWHTTNIYLHNGLHEYAEKLTAKLPEHLQVGVYNYTYNACTRYIYMCIHNPVCSQKMLCSVIIMLELKITVVSLFFSWRWCISLTAVLRLTT